MEGQADQKLIAHGRDDEVALTPAHLYYRSDLANAALGTEENRIHQAINNAQFFYDESPAESMADKDQDHLRDRVRRTMMTHPAIHGGEDMKFRCQIPYIAYLCPLKGDRPDDFVPPEEQDKELFEDFDGTNFIWAARQK